MVVGQLCVSFMNHEAPHVPARERVTHPPTTNTPVLTQPDIGRDRRGKGRAERAMEACGSRHSVKLQLHKSGEEVDTHRAPAFPLFASSYLDLVRVTSPTLHPELARRLP